MIAPPMVAVFAPTETVRSSAEPVLLRSSPFEKVSALFAVAAFSTKVVGAKFALPHTSVAAAPPRFTVTGAPKALKPLAPPVIATSPAAVPTARLNATPVSSTPPLSERLPAPKPTA